MLPVDLTIFVYVEKPNPPCMAKGKVDEGDRYAQKGPFKLSSKDCYATFLQKVSSVWSCPILHIPVEKMIWKPQTPQNSKPLPMGADTGSSTRIDALKAKGLMHVLGLSSCHHEKNPTKMW